MKLKIINRLLISCCFIVLMNSANAAIFANRQLCSCATGSPPDCTNMAKYESISMTCDWSKWTTGTDANAQITFNGKKTIQASCEFSGPDAVLMITGKKHADVQGVSGMPGNKFNFTINYQQDSSIADDNQNILIYLTNNNPSKENKLNCNFTTEAATAVKK